MPKITPGYVTRYIYGQETSLNTAKNAIISTDNQQDAIANHSDIEAELTSYLITLARKNRYLNSYACLGLFGGGLAGLAGAIIGAPAMPAKLAYCVILGQMQVRAPFLAAAWESFLIRLCQMTLA